MDGLGRGGCLRNYRNSPMAARRGGVTLDFH
jgi:hypothetical protein